MRDRPGGEAEIGLGLAAAGREEQQIDDLAVVVQRVLQARQVEQDEGELERPPFRLALRGRIAAVQDRLALSRRARDRFVHGAEGEPRMRIGAQELDAGGNAVARLRAEAIRRFAVACRGAPAMAAIPASCSAIQVS